MVPKGTKAKVEVHEREDYIGRELVRLDDNGRPVMNIITTRDEGQDCMVFAPTATGSGS
jgi:pheromone shutdown protein TraB